MSTLRNRQHESRITVARILLISFFFLVLFCILLGQTYRLQISKYDYYLSIAQNNKSQEISLMPFRSDIIDTNGLPLATYHAHYLLSPSNSLSDSASALFSELNLTPSNSEQSLSELQYARLYNHPDTKPLLSTKINRYYPRGAATAHLIGYTAIKDHSSLKLPDDSPYVQGKTGIESTYDAFIQGEPGLLTNILNAKREIVNHTVHRTPVRSQPLSLTINSRLQQHIFDQLSGLVGSVVVLDPNSGEILASVSSPSYDPNQIDRWVESNNLNDKPMFSRFSHALYPPASIIKPFIALMALEDGVIQPEDTIFDPGYYKLNDNSRVFRNHKRSGHGTVDLHKAIVLSNDPYFYDLAHTLGIEKLSSYLTKFKFGEKTNSHIPGEKSGIVPTKAYRDKHYKKWYAGQTVITGIGQGDLLCTPLQLARATMLLANNGYDYPLHILKHYVKPANKILDLNPNNRQLIVNAMQDVINNGTAKKLQGKPFTIAGKTGSAQVASLDSKTDYHSLPHHQKDHHLFVGFAPADKPSVVIVVVIEHQHFAVKVANSIFDWCWQHGLIPPS